MALRNGLDRNKIYDMSIYDDNKVLYLPLTTYKKTMKKSCMSCTTVPSLEPVDCDIFKCCASYIQEDFEDWTNRNPDIIKKEKSVVIEEVVKDNDNDVIDTKYIISKLSTYINKFKNERSDNYDTWTKMVWCIMNVCISNGIKERDCAKLVHQFSKISDNYNEDDVDTFFDKNYDGLKEASYGWKYMYECLKEDDEEFYNSIHTMTYNAMKSQFESKHAKILYPPMIVFDNDGKYDTMKITSAKEAYTHLKCKVSTFDKKSKKTVWETKAFIDLWLKDANMRVYNKIVFKPSPLVAKNDEFNIWDGCLYPHNH